jgi:hypothetical protein
MHSAQRRRTGARRRPIAALATLTLAVAGCGSSAPTPTATTTDGSPSPGSIAVQAFQYARCMRSHGVTAFPDPQAVDHDGQQGIKIGLPTGLAGTPAFQVAQTACHGDLPASRGGAAAGGPSDQARLAGGLGFARCMRAHGVSAFPDPTSQGQLTLEMVSGAGVDLQAPSVRSAALACCPPRTVC